MAAVTISFTLDDSKDQDLLDWLRSHGSRGRSAAIRFTLRQGLDSSRPVTVDDVRQAIRSEMATWVQAGSSGVVMQSPEPERAAVHLDNLERRLEKW